MKDEEIRRYSKLMDELDLRSLTLEEQGVKISLEKAVAGSVYIPAGQNTYAGEKAGERGGDPAMEKERSGEEEIVSVKSPMVGVFYAAPAENEDPYVSVGDRIKKGDILCIIEAMKLMSEIASEEDGVIEKICVTNGQLVEYGTEIMQIRKR